MGSLRELQSDELKNWQMSREFHLEAAKREIMACQDLEKLQKMCMNLLLQAEAQKDLIGTLLLRG